jgi:hypothetical protein
VHKCDSHFLIVLAKGAFWADWHLINVGAPEFQHSGQACPCAPVCFSANGSGTTRVSFALSADLFTSQNIVHVAALLFRPGFQSHDQFIPRGPGCSPASPAMTLKYPPEANCFAAPIKSGEEGRTLTSEKGLVCPQANQGCAPFDWRGNRGLNGGALPQRTWGVPGGACLRPALDAVAFHDLLAEFHAELALGVPGNRAQAERGFAIKAQPEQRGQALWLREFHLGTVLRDVAHGAVQVFGLERVEYRGLHKCRAARGAALFNAVNGILHWLTSPITRAGGKPRSEI